VNGICVQYKLLTLEEPLEISFVVLRVILSVISLLNLIVLLRISQLNNLML
jgi:hypothetical protein